MVSMLLRLNGLKIITKAKFGKSLFAGNGLQVFVFRITVTEKSAVNALNSSKLSRVRSKKIMEIKKTFAERLKDARIKANISQSELSKITGISPATLSSYESENKPKSPPIDKATTIAKALNASLDWLCGLEYSEESKMLTVQSILNAMDNGLCEFVSGYTKIMDFIKGSDYPLYLKNGLKKALFDKYIKKYQIYKDLFLSDKEKDEMKGDESNGDVDI